MPARSPGTGHLLFALFALVATLPACAPTGDAASDAPDFSELFTLVDTVALEEVPPDMIIDVDRIVVAPDGRIVLADRRANRVRVFDAEGRIVRTIGRMGGGPGEFDGLSSATMSADYLYAADGRNNRITRFDRELALDTAFAPPGIAAYPIAAVDGGLVAGIRERLRGKVWRLSSDGVAEQEILLPDSAAWAVPYWNAVLWREFARFRGDVLIATTLLYPLWRVRAGEAVPDSFGSPPPSFREASRPELGQFIGATQAELWEWLRSFSLVERVVPYRDERIIVVHGAYRPVPGEQWRRVHVSLDVYDAEGVKQHEDVAVPGQILSGGEHLWVLRSEPPGAWTIGRYEWAR